MSKVKLNYSGVIFEPESHTYTTPEGKRLSGVTALLSRKIFTNKYAGISKEVLDKAAAKGHMVHEAIEALDTYQMDSELPQVAWYKKIKDDYNLVVLENEYLVSDNSNIASAIDIVFDDLSLADIKTTSKIDMEYLSWQLSVYAYLFELQNPGLKANKLYVIWLPDPRYGSPCLKEIPRKTDEEVKNLIVSDILNIPFVSTPAETKGNNVPVSAKVIAEVCNIEREMKVAKARYDELKAGLLSLMLEYGCKSFSNDLLSISVKDAYEKETFDSKTFKAEHPDLYAMYVKKTNVGESLMLKVKQ